MSRVGDSAEPWWSEAGPDHCEFCLQRYRVELGYYCVDCDRPVCPVCVVTLHERQAVSCPECTRRAAED